MRKLIPVKIIAKLLIRKIPEIRDSSLNIKEEKCVK